jgi:hypothetical protein
MTEPKKYQGIELAREVAKAKLSDLNSARRNVQERREASQGSHASDRHTSSVRTDSQIGVDAKKG